MYGYRNWLFSHDWNHSIRGRTRKKCLSMATFWSILPTYLLLNRQTFLGVHPTHRPDWLGLGPSRTCRCLFMGRAHSIGKPKGRKRDTHFHKDWSAIRRPYSGIDNLLRLCGWSITFIYWNQCISRGYREENASVDLGKGGKT